MSKRLFHLSQDALRTPLRPHQHHRPNLHPPLPPLVHGQSRLYRPSGKHRPYQRNLFDEKDRERYALPGTLKTVCIPLVAEHGLGMVEESQMNQGR